MTLSVVEPEADPPNGTCQRLPDISADLADNRAWRRRLSVLEASLLHVVVAVQGATKFGGNELFHRQYQSCGERHSVWSS
jgi:hypothetical protein